MKTKTDEELLKIWDNHQNSYKEFWIYEKLTNKEKMRIFDLLKYRKPINIKEVNLG